MRYRTESFSGSGVRTAEDVIAFEVFELCNTDILSTLLDSDMLTTAPITDKSVWGDDVDRLRYAWWRRPTRDKAQQLIDELSENGEVSDFDDSDKLAFARELLASVRSLSGIDVRYALWLADIETVKEFYRANADDVEAYEVGKIVLSELGYDGSLYGYEEEPKIYIRKEIRQ